MSNWLRALIIWSVAALVVIVAVQLMLSNLWYSERHVQRIDGFDGIERTFSWVGPIILCIPGLIVFLVGIQRAFHVWSHTFDPSPRGRGGGPRA